MDVCEKCGESDESLLHTCQYCRQKFCSSHQLPENHDCPGLSYQELDTRHFESAFDETVGDGRTTADGGSPSVQSAEVRTVSNSKEPPKSELASSPDVMKDGSLKSETLVPERPTKSEAERFDIDWRPWAKRLLFFTGAIIAGGLVGMLL
jgi:hypothetical protein